jgi:outer membrane protein
MMPPMTKLTRFNLKPVFVAAALMAAGSASAANLLDVYSRAQQNDPQIREADANRLASRENKPQAIGALLPQLSATGSYNDDHQDGSRTQLTTGVDPADPNNVIFVPISTGYGSDTRTNSYNVQLRQTVFRWDQWATLKRADAQVAQAEADYGAAQQDLIVRTATRYFNVLAAQDTLDAAVAAEQAFGRQLEQANKRFEVGLIAITDVKEAQAAHDSAVAAVIQAKRTLTTNKGLLRELTGEEFGALAAPSDDMPLKSPDPADEDRWVSAALEQNVALASSRLAVDIARENTSIARSGHYPTLDLVAAHSGNKVTGDANIDTPLATQRSQVYPADSDITDNSISLQLSVPIYSGGATSSRVRQQVYLTRAARERLERTARETERQARDAYLGVLSEISRVTALKQALESNQTALQATEAGFDVGTRTTVDVLDARRQLFTAQTNFARSRYDYLLDVIALKQAAGTLSRTDIEEINSWLK